jgi:flagellar export protein FliJ
MKRFAFTLERVLAWRRMQARMERLKWEQIRAELRSIEAQREHLRGERERAAARLNTAASATGADFAALDRFRKHVDSERARLETKRTECAQRLLAQTHVTTAKERDVKVLEHLRERCLKTWTAELDRETEQQAAESYLSRWRIPTQGRVK